MNSELCRKAIEKVGNPNILVNLISRRVRQLTSGGGANSRPLIMETAGMGAADIALSVALLSAGAAKVTPNQPVTLGVRPEHLTVGGKSDAVLMAKIRLAEYLGSETMFYASLPDGADLSVKADGLAKAAAGSDLAVGIPAAACHLFDASGKAIINGDLTK